MSSRASTISTIAGVTVLSGALAYVVYFDYKRRNDVEFRKQLRKDKKKADKAATVSKVQGATQFSGNHAEELRAALEKIRAEPLPDTTNDKETYFMSQAGLGEQLCTQGPAFALPAALAFFRALRVYPSPVELIMLYQQSLPPEVFALIMELTNLDVAHRVEGYYNFFPRKSMNVSVKDKGEGKKILVAEKDFEEGDEIYTEEPIVTALDWDLQELGSHCTYCLRLLHKATAITPEGDRINAAYCSKECQIKSEAQHHNLLFGLDPLLPPEVPVGGPIPPKELRDKAQQRLTEHLKAHKKTMSVLAAKYVSRQITIETSKMVVQPSPAPTDPPRLTEANSPEYGIADHLERLRFVDVSVPENETKLICAAFGAALPGLEQSLNEETHATMLGKLTYNAIGICYSGGRDDRPASAERPEDQERTRTPYGTSRQIGSGIYLVSAYLGHSCEPVVRPSFTSGTSELHLVAARPIKKGDELTMAFIDVTQHEGETAEEARRRRRYELARGWRFKCECVRCAAEAGEGAGADADVGVSQDESKVEASVERFERARAGESPEQD